MSPSRFRFALVCLTAWAALGCSSGHDAGALAPTTTGGGSGAGSGGDAEVPLATRTHAVGAVIDDDPACRALPSFYWEIGDASGLLASGTVGTSFTSVTLMNIASASKLVFGAYVVERFKNDLTRVDLGALRMLSGYRNLSYESCLGESTVGRCLEDGANGSLTQADVGSFFYNGGHFQKYAVDLGLGGDDDDALARDLKAVLGTDLSFRYSSPQLAAGIRTTAADYASFLRKILGRKLAIADHLGENAVCTLPGACSAARYSPATAAWHYSYAHWVEDDASGDGAFSSPGAFGFYPWIDASKTYYGVLARASLTSQAYLESATCGGRLRKAFVTGKAP